MLFNRSNKDMGFHEEYVCNIGLGLGLSYDQGNLDGSFKSHNKKPCFRFDSSTRTTTLEPSLALGLSDETTYQQVAGKLDMNKAYEESSRNIDVHWQTSPNSTTVSSFSNTRVKREKELGFEDIEVEKVSSRVSDEDEEGSARKKLRLTKEQSALLEDSFKEHSTLNPKQKQALAKQLSLRPRQVEVWFQNRRARTKLKQTEVDCEFLKKCCENLTEENRRLHKELQELKALKLSSQPLYMQLPAATLSVCPSCERIGNGGSTGSGGDGGSSKNNPFTNIAVPKQAHFFSPFNNHSSAAC